MKKIYLLTACVVSLTMMSSCNDDEEGDIKMPSAISNLTAEPREGAVMLRWNVPADSALIYVEISYQSANTGKVMKRNSSLWCDSMLVDGLLAKDGEYTFNATPMSDTYTRGETVSCTATAGQVQPVVEEKSTQITLTAENLKCNKPDPDEGKDIGTLVDGNYENFFHTDWHNAGTKPHYIDIALPQPVETFKLCTYYRGGNFGTCPELLTIYGSNDGETWETIAELEDTGEGESNFTTEVLGTEGKKYSHLRYYANRTTNNRVYFALAELEVYKITYEVYDPEGIYKPSEE